MRNSWVDLSSCTYFYIVVCIADSFIFTLYFSLYFYKASSLRLCVRQKITAETKSIPNATTDATTPKTHDEVLEAFLVAKDAQLHYCKVAH